jgi:hypothetical protein
LILFRFVVGKLPIRAMFARHSVYARMLDGLDLNH